MSKLFNWAAARLVAAFALALPLAADASPLLLAVSNALEKENPVTGETEIYDNGFDGGESSEWNRADNWTLKETDKVPFVSGGNYGPALVDGKEVTTETAIDGWNLRVGAYNGAAVTWKSLGKIQGDTNMWLTVDATSSIAIDGWGGGNLGQNGKNLNYYVAAQNGVTWGVDLASGTDQGLTMNYYLAGNGSVSYKSLEKCSHVIKAADVTLSGTSRVEPKILVSFASSTKTFTADAAIKVYGTGGTTLVTTVNLATVNTTGTTTLTPGSPVGSCELVQTSTGIVLYYVDGDPAAIVPKTYLPSISVNFTSGTALSTHADVGVGEYAIPGTSWNNLIGNNGTLSTVTQVDSTGVASTVAGVSVAVSGTRGYWTCGNVSAATDLRQGYIDDAAGANASPQVVVSGIPYYSYYAVVYFSNNDANVKFGYVTINGTNYKWDDTTSALVECEGASTDSWGASSPTAWTEGGNYIVTPTIVNADGTFTVVGHRLTSARAGIAAIQIVEVPKTAEEGELVINVSGDKTYTVSEDATYTTVYVTGVGTLAFSGEGAITTTTLNVGAGATVPMGSSITPTTVVGAGTVVYAGVQPSTTLGFDDSDNWFGTVWVKNIGTSPAGETATTAVTLGTDTNTAADNTINLWGNVNSCVKFTNVRGHVAASDCPWTLILEDDGDKYAWYNNNGWTAQNKDPVFAKLTGEGTFYDQANIGCRQNVTFTDATEFSGTFTVAGKRIGLGGVNTAQNNEAYRGTIEVVSGAAATIASGKTWTTGTGFRINGTLNVNGTLAAESTATTCVTGSGTVVFTGRAPTPTGDTWWKNANWTGTVQMKDVTNLVGASNYSGTNFLPVDYGNTGSVLELYNCSGWLPNNSNYQCTVPLKITGTLTINNGISGSKFVISSLSGDGTIYTDSNTATITIQVLEAANFTGKVQLNSKRVVFGNTLPSEFTVGNIYVGEGFSFTVPNSNVAWYGTGGITLAGELKAAALSNFGGGTTITTTDTGVFTLVSNSNTDDMDVDYTRIQGTGTLKFDGTNYRTISTNNFPTALVVENNLTAGLLHRIPNLEVTIGSLSGSGYLRSDWGGSAGDRSLKVLQAKDTTWSGKFWTANPHRFGTLRVAPGASTAGTLTISATHETAESTALQVDSGASVNLTGTWVGATTVSGTFGGTGTLTGDLTFSEGATFKAFAADDEDGLVVSGTVGYPAEGTVTVDVSAIEPETDVALIKATDLNSDKFVLATGAPEGYALKVVDGVLTLTVPHVTITVPSIANTTVTVKIGDNTIGTSSGDYNVAPDSVVTVTYVAVDGYEISGTTEYTIDTSKSETTFNPAGTTEVKQYVASVTTGELVVKYTSLQAAIDATAQTNSKIVLLANEEDGATIPAVDGKMFYFYAGEFSHGEIANAEGNFITTSTEETISIGGAEVTATKYRVNAVVALVVLANEQSGTYYGDPMLAYNAFLAGPVGTTMQVFGNNPFSTEIPCTTYDSETQTYTKLAAVASITVGQVTSNYPSLADAVAAAEAGQTVTMLADDRVSFAAVTVEDGVPSGGSIVIDKNLTIDGSGFTVYGNTNADILNATGSATPGLDMVADLVDGSNLLGFFVKSGNVTFQNVTLTEFGNTAYVNKFGYTPIQTASAYTGKLTLTNVNFNKFNRTAVCVRGGTLEMTGGTVSGGTVNKNNGDYFQQPLEVRGGTATISGVTITGGDDVAGNGGGAIVAWGDTTVNNVNIDFTGVGVWADVANVAITGDDTEISATTQSVFVEEGGSATIAAGDFAGSLAVDSDANSSITVSGGTFDAVVPDEYLAEGYEVLDNGDGTYGVREDKGWVYSTPGYWNYTGTWSDGATLGEEKVTIEDGATYTASEASDGRFVTVAMTLSFDDANDDDDDFGDAKAAIRLAAGETDGTYQFQLYTSDGENKVWTNATVEIEATKEEDYNFVFVLDLTNKTYTASIVSGATTNVLSIGESITTIPFACQGEVTPVQTIDFVGSGTVSSIEGSYEDAPAPEGFVEDEVVTLAGDDTATLTAAQATWLNACGAKVAVAAKIATMDSTAFNNAYLLNLDITGEFSYEFKVTNINVGDTTVTMTVSLTRTGVLDETTKINGTVVLTGTDELGKKFETISEATVADDDFSGSNTTTITLDKGDAKFFQPVIK